MISPPPTAPYRYPIPLPWLCRSNFRHALLVHHHTCADGWLRSGIRKNSAANGILANSATPQSTCDGALAPQVAGTEAFLRCAAQDQRARLAEQFLVVRILQQQLR